LTEIGAALECSHVFEVNEAFHHQSELDAEARRVAVQGSQRAPGWWWEVERLEINQVSQTHRRLPAVGFCLPVTAGLTGNQHEN
jgi:hypothetical protein